MTTQYYPKGPSQSWTLCNYMGCMPRRPALGIDSVTITMVTLWLIMVTTLGESSLPFSLRCDIRPRVPQATLPPETQPALLHLLQ